MKKILTVLFIASLYKISYTQTKTGIVYYGEIQSLGLGSPVGKDYSAILVFNSEKSLYITRQDSLEHLTPKTDKQKFYFSVSTNKEGFQYYNDVKKDTLYSRDLGFTYVKEKLPKLSWILTNEIKLIGDFECRKANTFFRGRDYTVWFTTDIPLPFGPWKLQGLPGLILEAYDTYKEIYWYFKEISYPSPYSYLLKPISNPNPSWISFKEYKTGIIEKFKESIIAGKILNEKVGIKSYAPKDMSGDYIEVFKHEKD